MAINLAQIVRITLTVLVLGAYSLFAHFGTVASADSWMAVAMAVGPIMALAIIHVGTAYRLAVVLGCGLVVTYLLLQRALTGLDLSWIYFIQHAGTNAILCYVFGQSLRAGRTPSVSRMAMLLEGALQPEVSRYTRQVTVAWTIFFGLAATISSLLYFMAPLVTWSIFANILYAPLVLAMFGIEYLVRVLILPRGVHTNLLVTLQAVWKTFSSSRP